MTCGKDRKPRTDRSFNSSTKSGGQRKKGQKGKMLRRREGCLEEDSVEGLEMKRLVSSVKYFREASEVKAGSTHWVIQLTILKEGSYRRAVGMDVRLE